MPVLQLVNSESSANIGKESDISGRIYSIQGSHSGADKSQVRIIVTCLTFHLCLDCTVINTYIFCGYFKGSRSPIIQSDYNLCGIIVVKTINRDDMLRCLLKSSVTSFSADFPFTVTVPPQASSVEKTATALKGDIPYGLTTIRASSRL